MPSMIRPPLLRCPLPRCFWHKHPLLQRVANSAGDGVSQSRWTPHWVPTGNPELGVDAAGVLDANSQMLKNTSNGGHLHVGGSWVIQDGALQDGEPPCAHRT